MCSKLFSDPGQKRDLFKTLPWLQRLFYNQRFHHIWQTFLVVLFLVLILSGLFGPQAPGSNIILYLCWGVWWPSVILSLFFVGRLWCGVCPFPVAGKFLQTWHLSLEKKVPKILIKNSVTISVCFFMAIIWVEEATGMKDSPKETTWLLLIILGGATFCAMLFSKQAWCQYFCPLGRLMGIGASISLIEFRPDHSACRQCTTFACNRGVEMEPGCPVSLGAYKVTNNLECLVCGRCMHLCDHDSPQLNIRHPLSELIIRKGRLISCTLMIPFLMGSQLARLLDQNIFNLMENIQSACMNGWVCQMGLYAVPLFLGFSILYVVIIYGDLMFGVFNDEIMGRFSPMVPILLPLAFGGELVSRLNFTVRNFTDFLPTFGRQFGVKALESLTVAVPEWVYPAYGLAIMFVSELAGLYILDKFYGEEFEGVIAWWQYRFIQVGYFFLFGIYIYLMSTGWHIPSLNVMLLFQ